MWELKQLLLLIWGTAGLISETFSYKINHLIIQPDQMQNIINLKHICIFLWHCDNRREAQSDSNSTNAENISCNSRGLYSCSKRTGTVSRSYVGLWCVWMPVSLALCLWERDLIAAAKMKSSTIHKNSHFQPFHLSCKQPDDIQLHVCSHATNWVQPGYANAFKMAFDRA